MARAQDIQLGHDEPQSGRFFSVSGSAPADSSSVAPGEGVTIEAQVVRRGRRQWPAVGRDRAMRLVRLLDANDPSPRAPTKPTTLIVDSPEAEAF